MIDPLAGMLWITGISAVLLAVYFGRHLWPGVTPTSGKNIGEAPVGEQAEKQWNSSFAVVLGALGLVGLVQGLWMMDTWPLVGSYNILFGEVFTAYSLILLAGAYIVIKGYSLKALSYMAGLVGIWGLVDAYGILSLNMTSEPIIAAGLYAAGGLAGILSVPVVHRPSRASAAALVLFLALFALAALFLGA
ncbi:MAG: DUF981 family protein, partial [Thermoprotei archaeon]